LTKYIGKYIIEFMNIEESILSYNFNGKMDWIYKKYDTKDIVNMVLNILENTSVANYFNMELFNTAITFITDTIVFSDLSEIDKKIFVKTLLELNFFEKIEEYLYNEYLNIKCAVIHSIGKISIKDNIKYLEKAFEKYYNQNPIICSKLLCEIRWLDSKKYNHYYSLIKTDMDLINSMALSIDTDDCAYEIMVYNIQNNLKQKDWTREEYIKSIKYYRNHNGERCTDYKKIYSDIQNYK
jgi:hypothetical protein